MLVLGIESSCDETAASIIDSGKILSSLVATQHDVHEKYGGVVPELASRRHMENIVPLVRAALDEAGKKLCDVEGVAVTCAPGLVGSLLVGIQAAKGIAVARGIPFIGVNHLEGHLNAAALEFGDIPLPYVALVVSGGHTSIYLVKKFGDYTLLGATRDDAAGEAFDKVAKLLQLGYPGGPAIDRAARSGDAKAFRFSRPKFAAKPMKGVVARPYDHSFSGIKTAVLNLYRKQQEKGVDEKFVCDVAASFQEAVAKVLVENLLDAAKRHAAAAAVISGGVAANSRLRELMKVRAAEEGVACFIPKMALCTDNAAMIAFVGEKLIASGKRSDFSLNATANQEIGI